MADPVRRTVLPDGFIRYDLPDGTTQTFSDEKEFGRSGYIVRWWLEREERARERESRVTER